MKADAIIQADDAPAAPDYIDTAMKAHGFTAWDMAYFPLSIIGTVSLQVARLTATRASQMYMWQGVGRTQEQAYRNLVDTLASWLLAHP